MGGWGPGAQRLVGSGGTAPGGVRGRSAWWGPGAQRLVGSGGAAPGGVRGAAPGGVLGRRGAWGRNPRIFCEIRGPRAILAIENANIYVAINMQLMYNFAEIIESKQFAV